MPAFKTWSHNNRGQNPRSNRTFAVNKRKAARAAGFAARRGFRGSAPTYRTLGMYGGARVKKFVDGQNGSAGNTSLAISTTGTVTLLNATQEGTGYWNRLGETIAMDSLFLHGYFSNNTGTNGIDYARVLVIYDRQPSSTAGRTLPTIGDILANIDQSGTITLAGAGVAAGSNMDIHPVFRKRYAILADERIVLPITTDTAMSPLDSAQKTALNVKRYIKLKGLETQYINTASPCTIANFESGSLLLVTVGTDALGSYSWNFNANWRLRFRDSA